MAGLINDTSRGLLSGSIFPIILQFSGIDGMIFSEVLVMFGRQRIQSPMHSSFNM